MNPRREHQGTCLVETCPTTPVETNVPGISVQLISTCTMDYPAFTVSSDASHLLLSRLGMLQVRLTTGGGMDLLTRCALSSESGRHKHEGMKGMQTHQILTVMSLISKGYLQLCVCVGVCVCVCVCV